MRHTEDLALFVIFPKLPSQEICLGRVTPIHLPIIRLEDYQMGLIPAEVERQGRTKKPSVMVTLPLSFQDSIHSRRFMIPTPQTILPGVHNLFAGETYVYDTTDATGTISNTYPFILYQRMPPLLPYDMGAGTSPYDYLGPYFLGLPAYRAPNIVTNTAVDLGFSMVDSTPTRTVPFFAGAVAVDVLPPFGICQG